jgi:curved DNA-binding protein CbpA
MKNWEDNIYPNMKTQTHYTKLGLAPNAPREVILAAYKALALKYHPEKTLELAEAERAAHAMAFSDLQEAFDVLNDDVHKAAYDAALARDESEIVDEVSAFQYHTQPMLTMQERYSSMRALARQQLEHWRVLREKRQVAEACLSVADLESLVKVWEDLENENTADPPMKARCAILAHEYSVEIDTRGRNHEDLLEKASRSGRTPMLLTTPVAVNHRPVTTNAPTESTTAVPAPSPKTSDVAARCTHSDISLTPTPFSRLKARADERKRAEEKRAEEAKARAKARKGRKAQIKVAKQIQLEEKAAFVRAEKEKQKAMAEDRARLKAEHIAKVRAKVRGAPIGIDTVDDDFIVSGVQEESLSHGIDASNEGMQGEPKL